MKKKWIFRIILIIFIIIPILYISAWHFYTPTIRNFDGLVIEDFGLDEPLNLYFDMSRIGYNGLPFTPQNHIVTVDTTTDEYEVFVAPSYLHGHEVHDNGYTSYYEIPPINVIGQQYNIKASGIPYATGGYYVVRDENNRIETRISDETGVDFHELVITDEGNYIYFAAQLYDTYRDPTTVCLPLCFNFTQAIVEVTPDGEELYRYSLEDYYDRDDFDLNDFFRQGGANLYDTTHANSIRISPDNNLIVSVRHTDEVLAISRETGDIAWRSRDYTLIDDPIGGWSHQHDAQILDNGNLLLFDNGNATDVTRLVEYEIDHEAQTMTLVWSHEADRWQPNRGSVRLTPAGNFVVNWVQREAGTVQVITRDGDVLYNIIMPAEYSSYRADYDLVD